MPLPPHSMVVFLIVAVRWLFRLYMYMYTGISLNPILCLLCLDFHCNFYLDCFPFLATVQLQSPLYEFLNSSTEMSVVGGAFEAVGPMNCSRVQCLTLTTLGVTSTQAPSHCLSVSCENSRFSSPLHAGDVSRGETSATQQQKFHTDDLNQCLHNKSSSHGVPNADLFNFTFLLVNFG